MIIFLFVFSAKHLLTDVTLVNSEETSLVLVKGTIIMLNFIKNKLIINLFYSRGSTIQPIDVTPKSVGRIES